MDYFFAGFIGWTVGIFMIIGLMLSSGVFARDGLAASRYGLPQEVWLRVKEKSQTCPGHLLVTTAETVGPARFFDPGPNANLSEGQWFMIQKGEDGKLEIVPHPETLGKNVDILG